MSSSMFNTNGSRNKVVIHVVHVVSGRRKWCQYLPIWHIFDWYQNDLVELIRVALPGVRNTWPTAILKSLNQAVSVEYTAE